MVVHIIEGDDAVRRALQTCVAQEGHAVVTHASALGFLCQWPGGNGDIIVVDIHPPDMDGGDLAALIRARQDTLRIVVISGLRLERYREAIDRILPFASFRKPIDVSAFLAAIGAAAAV